MKKVVFISSLSHSGSTLLDLILGGHSRFVGLGEIRQVLDLESLEREKIGKVVCSCTHIPWRSVSSGARLYPN